jgi:hypothetical protein
MQLPDTVRIATPADDELLRSIVNHPEVARWNSSDGAPAFNPSDYTAHAKSFAVIAEGGCFLAPALEQGAYAVHTNMLPTAHGAAALRAAHDALAFVFLRTDVEQLYSMVPSNNPQAGWFAQAMGFRKTFVAKDGWCQGGRWYDLQHYTMGIDDWVQRKPIILAQIGRWFHSTLEERGGAVEHAQDELHDSYVGAAYELINCGRVDKACRLYNRWARYAGYQPFEILSTDPLRIDIHDCVLRLGTTGGQAYFEIEERAHG